MLMLQPPGRGSTYRYVLPQGTLRKRIVALTALVRRMRGPRPPVYVGKRDLPDLPYGRPYRSAMMSRPCRPYAKHAPEPVCGC
ncbi:hypothetical protein GCM10010271_58800 [Streptomyces kurssanovii]|nr:hypothetical protein GCM10010271_58800 [Streptomyces kurssanovii]